MKQGRSLQERDVDSYDRATELEAARWTVINMPPALYDQLATLN